MKKISLSALSMAAVLALGDAFVFRMLSASPLAEAVVLLALILAGIIALAITAHFTKAIDVQEIREFLARRKDA